MENLGLKVYLLFIMSWFLHFGSRVPFLGSIRFDFILFAILIAFAIPLVSNSNRLRNKEDYLIRLLILYSIISIPFVQWPGSVIVNGLPELIKAVSFYYFTVLFIKTQKDLKHLIFIFVTCQSIRILEPTYLHVMEGYWGNLTSMSDSTFMNRLAGAPHDIINPNGLAFIICNTIPFLYYFRDYSWKIWLFYIGLTPIFIYALILTGSRSGIIGFLVIFFTILMKLKWRFLIFISILVIAIGGFSFLSPDLQDRYLSIVGLGERNAATAHHREEGIYRDIAVALRRPIFGHGLGTSLEANSHFGGAYLRAHNLYTELAQELGLIGLVIFILLIKTIFKSFKQSRRALDQQNITGFLPKLVDVIKVLLLLNLIWNFATYALSTYIWYFLAGITVVVRRISLANSSTYPSAELGVLVHEPLKEAHRGR